MFTGASLLQHALFWKVKLDLIRRKRKHFNCVGAWRSKREEDSRCFGLSVVRTVRGILLRSKHTRWSFLIISSTWELKREAATFSVQQTNQTRKPVLDRHLKKNKTESIGKTSSETLITSSCDLFRWTRSTGNIRSEQSIYSMSQKGTINNTESISKCLTETPRRQKSGADDNQNTLKSNFEHFIGFIFQNTWIKKAETLFFLGGNIRLKPLHVLCLIQLVVLSWTNTLWLDYVEISVYKTPKISSIVFTSWRNIRLELFNAVITNETYLSTNSAIYVAKTMKK